MAYVVAWGGDDESILHGRIFETSGIFCSILASLAPLPEGRVWPTCLGGVVLRPGLQADAVFFCHVRGENLQRRGVFLPAGVDRLRGEQTGFQGMVHAQRREGVKRHGRVTDSQPVLACCSIESRGVGSDDYVG